MTSRGVTFSEGGGSDEGKFKEDPYIPFYERELNDEEKEMWDQIVQEEMQKMEAEIRERMAQEEMAMNASTDVPQSEAPRRQHRMREMDDLLLAELQGECSWGGVSAGSSAHFQSNEDPYTLINAGPARAIPPKPRGGTFQADPEIVVKAPPAPSYRGPPQNRREQESYHTSTSTSGANGLSDAIFDGAAPDEFRYARPPSGTSTAAALASQGAGHSKAIEPSGGAEHEPARAEPSLTSIGGIGAQDSSNRTADERRRRQREYAQQLASDAASNPANAALSGGAKGRIERAHRRQSDDDTMSLSSTSDMDDYGAMLQGTGASRTALVERKRMQQQMYVEQLREQQQLERIREQEARAASGRRIRQADVQDSRNDLSLPLRAAPAPNPELIAARESKREAQALYAQQLAAQQNFKREQDVSAGRADVFRRQNDSSAAQLRTGDGWPRQVSAGGAGDYALRDGTQHPSSGGTPYITQNRMPYATSDAGDTASEYEKKRAAQLRLQQELARDQEAVPIQTERVSLASKSRQGPVPQQSVPDEGLWGTLGAHDGFAKEQKRALQQQYHRQLSEAAAQAPIPTERVSRIRRDVPRDQESQAQQRDNAQAPRGRFQEFKHEPSSTSNSVADSRREGAKDFFASADPQSMVREERENKRRAQEEYARQLREAAAAVPLESPRQPLHRRRQQQYPLPPEEHKNPRSPGSLLSTGLTTVGPNTSLVLKREQQREYRQELDRDRFAEPITSDRVPLKRYQPPPPPSQTGLRVGASDLSTSVQRHQHREQQEEYAVALENDRKAAPIPNTRVPLYRAPVYDPYIATGLQIGVPTAVQNERHKQKTMEFAKQLQQDSYAQPIPTSRAPLSPRRVQEDPPGYGGMTSLRLDSMDLITAEQKAARKRVQDRYAQELNEQIATMQPAGGNQQYQNRVALPILQREYEQLGNGLPGERAWQQSTGEGLGHGDGVVGAYKSGDQSATRRINRTGTEIDYARSLYQQPYYQ